MRRVGSVGVSSDGSFPRLRQSAPCFWQRIRGGIDDPSTSEHAARTVRSLRNRLHPFTVTTCNYCHSLQMFTVYPRFQYYGSGATAAPRQLYLFKLERRSFLISSECFCAARTGRSYVPLKCFESEAHILHLKIPRRLQLAGIRLLALWSQKSRRVGSLASGKLSDMEAVVFV